MWEGPSLAAERYVRAATTLLTDEQADAIELLAEERQVSISSVVREAIREYLAARAARELAAYAQ